MASEIKVDTIVNASGDEDSGIDLSTNDVVAVKTANTERMRVDATGKVGIGTNSPSSYDDEADNFVIYEAGSSGHAGMTIANDGNNARGHILFADGTSGSQAYQGAVSYDHSNNNMYFRTGGTERFRVTDTKFSTAQKHVEHAKSLGNVQREVVGFYEANMSTSYNTIFTVGTGNIHLGYFYEVIFFGGDWGGHSTARAYKKGFINGYNGYTGHNSIEQSGVHSGAQIIENVTWTGSGNSQVSNYQLKLNTGSVGARIYIRLVGTINTFTITN